MKSIIFFFTVLIISLIILLLNINLALASSIGVSPAMLIFENESINRSITIINTNNESLSFDVKSKNDLLGFKPENGKLKQNSNLIIDVYFNPHIDMVNGSYEDIIFVTVFKQGNLKNSVGIKVFLNISKNISSVEYYLMAQTFYDKNITKSEFISEKGKLGNLITGMSVFYDGELKGNSFISIIIIGIIILCLYLLIKENKIRDKKDKL